MNDQTRADILKAVQVIKERGWCKRNYETWATHEVCMIGALRIATLGVPDLYNAETTHEERTRYWNAYEAIEDVTVMRPEHFNDRKTTRRRHVIRALRKAARA